MSDTGGWLRVVLYDICDGTFDHFETALRYMRSSVRYFSGVLGDQPGFVRAHWGADLDEGKVAAVTRWESLQSIVAAHTDLERLAADAAVHGIRRVHVQNIELFPSGAAGTLEDDTWLRVVSYSASPDDPEAQAYVGAHLTEFLGLLGTQPGFRGGQWGRDLATGTICAVTSWDSRRAIAAARPALQRLQVEAAAARLRPLDAHNIHLFAVSARPAAFAGR